MDTALWHRSPSVSTLNPTSVISCTARLLSTSKLHTRIRSRFWRDPCLRHCVFAAQSERPLITGVLLIVGAISYGVVNLTELRRSAPATVAPAHRQVTFTGKDGDPALSPDGSRIAYVSAGKPDKLLMVQELAGGQPLEVFSAPEIGHVRWSPDGSELLIWTRGSGRDGIYVLPQLGGTPRRIVADQYLACWSPDGATIAVATYLGGKIWFLNKHGRHERSISLQDVHSSIWGIDWSPANGLLTFITNDNQRRYTIWTVRPDGSDKKKVVTADTEISSARWAPDGDAIYFSRRLNQTFSFYKIPVHGGDENPEPVATTLLTGLEAEPSFALSADGKRLAYARAPFFSNLWMLETAAGVSNQTTETKELTHGYFARRETQHFAGRNIGRLQYRS